MEVRLFRGKPFSGRFQDVLLLRKLAMLPVERKAFANNGKNKNMHRHLTTWMSRVAPHSLLGGILGRSPDTHEIACSLNIQDLDPSQEVVAIFFLDRCKCRSLLFLRRGTSVFQNKSVVQHWGSIRTGCVCYNCLLQGLCLFEELKLTSRVSKKVKGQSGSEGSGS